MYGGSLCYGGDCLKPLHISVAGTTASYLVVSCHAAPFDQQALSPDECMCPMYP